jgi:two-component system invasion response regulator UvrY
MIRVFLADDHEIVREGVKRVVMRAPDMAVVGEASDGEEVLARAEKEVWDVLVLDLTLPKRSGLDVLGRLKQRRPSLRIVVLTMHAEDQYAVRILRSGADAYLTKGRPSSELLDAIRAVAGGGKYITPRLGELLLAPVGSGGSAPHELFTDRELEVLIALARGSSPSAIADQLSVSPSTVSTHLRAIKTKLGAESLAALVQYALRVGLLEG